MGARVNDAKRARSKHALAAIGLFLALFVSLDIRLSQMATIQNGAFGVKRMVDTAMHERFGSADRDLARAK